MADFKTIKRQVVKGTTFSLTLQYTNDDGTPWDFASSDQLSMEVYSLKTGENLGRYQGKVTDNVVRFAVGTFQATQWPVGTLGLQVLRSTRTGRECDVLGTLTVLSGRDL